MSESRLSSLVAQARAAASTNSRQPCFDKRGGDKELEDVDLFDQSYTFRNSLDRPDAQPDNQTTTESDMESDEFRRGFAAGARAKVQQDDQAQDPVLGLVRRLKKEVEELREDFEDKNKQVDRQMKRLREEWKDELRDLDNKVGRNHKAQAKSLEDFKKR